MKTDALFYKLFRIAPRSLFRLVRLKLDGDYAFESITVKTTEKRFDGFMKPKDGKGPNVFVEIQGYDDNTIYWRSFREVCAWYEENDSDRPFILIILFTDEKYDPDNRMLSCRPPCRLIRKNLADCLKGIGKKAGVLTVLKPLMLSDRKKDRERLPELVPQWEEAIRSLELPEHETNELTELLLYAVVQRFRKLTLKEVEKMIQLTPLDQTVAGQELIQIGVEIGEEKGREEGREKGREEGREEGELIGRIQTMQQFLKRPVMSKKKLFDKNISELKSVLKKLESELKL
ncbi:DUF2887 [Desulfonema magnum]|uniref:DUF2887 n=2 Tax=Desulfonema magnum TaxID=45655 RepID=A0A975BWZ4_9BACT|nr:DUF2887 [Desulfonema magnum]